MWIHKVIFQVKKTNISGSCMCLGIYFSRSILTLGGWSASQNKIWPTLGMREGGVDTSDYLLFVDLKLPFSRVKGFNFQEVNGFQNTGHIAWNIPECTLTLTRPYNTPVGIEIYQGKAYSLRRKITKSSLLYKARYLSPGSIQMARHSAFT